MLNHLFYSRESIIKHSVLRYIMPFKSNQNVQFIYLKINIFYSLKNKRDKMTYNTKIKIKNASVQI